MPYRYAHWYVLTLFPLAALAFWPTYLGQFRTAGVEMHAKPGAMVRGGEPLFTLHTDEPDRFARAEEVLASAVTIAPEDSSPDLPSLVLDRIAE